MPQPVPGWIARESLQEFARVASLPESEHLQPHPTAVSVPMAAVIYAARLFSAEVALGSPLVFYTSPEIETCYPPLICPRDRKDLARGLRVGVARSLSAPSDLRPPCLIEARKHPRVDDVILLSLNPHTLRLLVDVVGLVVVRVDEAVILAPLVPVARELAPMDCLRRARNIPPEVLPRRCAARNAGAA